MIVIAQQGAYFVNKWGRAVKRPFADKAAAVQCIAKHAKSLPVEGGGCECNEQTEGVNRGSAVYGNPSVNTPCGVLPAPPQAVAPLGSQMQSNISAPKAVPACGESGAAQAVTKGE